MAKMPSAHGKYWGFCAIRVTLPKAKVSNLRYNLAEHRDFL